MSILGSIKAISNIYIILSVNHLDNSVSNCILLVIDIFYLSGADPTYPPISPYKLRCKEFAVDNYSWILCALPPLMLGWGGLASTRE
jgi:hypothetical protein